MIKRITSGLSALVLSVSSIFVFAPVLVSAAVDTCTWTGAGDGINFSDGSNWSGCDNSGVPENGDSLVLDTDALSDDEIISNDINGLSINTITQSGSASYGFSVAGPELLTLTGNVTNNNSSEYLNFEGDLALSASLSFVGAVSVSSPGGNPTIALGANNLTLNNSVSCYSISLTADISGSGGIVKTGTEAAVLGGLNTYSGTTTVNQGFLAVTPSSSLGSTAAGTTVASGATLGLAGFGSSRTVNENITVGGSGLANQGAIVDYSYGCSGGGAPEEPLNLTLSGDIVLTANTVVRGYASNITITGALSGNYTISMKEGSLGSLIINASSNSSKTPNGTLKTAPQVIKYEGDQSDQSFYIGSNTIAEVTGKVGGVIVASGGTLKGTGTTGTIYVEDGGTLAPGLSPGCLSSGNLTLAGIYQVEIAGTTVCTEYDQTNVTGTVDVSGGTLEISHLNDYLPVAGDVFVIINNDGADAVTGTFEGLAEGATITVDEVAYRVSYVGGDGNDVTLTVISAPDTGFGTLSTNPALIFAASAIAASAILVLGRKYTKFAA
jgi:fibronectin-binding autotransporter adhesin